MRRKIQLVGGTTYSVSLPKAWVEKNHLKKNSDLQFKERDDGSLILTPPTESIESDIKQFSINVDEYCDEIEQLLFVLYYSGIENVSLFSKAKIPVKLKLRIKKALEDMSGTEVVFEDTTRIDIRVLLDKSRVDVAKILQRICLIINSSIATMLDDFNKDVIEMNEREVDRLYQLTTKMVSISLRNHSVLKSSGINNISLIPSYFLIGKRLESIADLLYVMSKDVMIPTLSNKRIVLLEIIKKEVNRIRKAPSTKHFKRISKVELQEYMKTASALNDKFLSNLFEDLIRFIVDAEEEILNISFYDMLINEKII